MPVVSSIKPDQPQTVKKKFEYEDRSYVSYVENGFSEDIPDHILQPYGREQVFLAGLDIDRHPKDFKRSIVCFNRFKNEDGDEVLTYHEKWEGKNFLGRDLDPVIDHWEGYYFEQERVPKYDDKGVITHYEKGKQKTIYTIPWEGKKTLDKEIAKSNAKKDQIKYHFDAKPETQNDYANYEQFANLSYTECYNICLKPGGFRAEWLRELQRRDQLKDK